MVRPKQNLYKANVTMILLCALTGFYLLVSPLVPYTFEVQTVRGLALFVAAHQAFTMVIGSVGVKLNVLADREVRITGDLVRGVLRRSRR